MKRFVSDQIAVPVWEGEAQFARADLELHGISHRGDTYEGLVYLNNKRATARTGREPADGFAGSFTVFGHGPCFGEDGHCQIASGPIHPFDYRRPHPLTPQVAVVNITMRLRSLIDAGASELTLTVIPIDDRGRAAGDVLNFERASLITYD